MSITNVPGTLEHTWTAAATHVELIFNTGTTFESAFVMVDGVKHTFEALTLLQFQRTFISSSMYRVAEVHVAKSNLSIAHQFKS